MTTGMNWRWDGARRDAEERRMKGVARWHLGLPRACREPVVY